MRTDPYPEIKPDHRAASVAPHDAPSRRPRHASVGALVCAAVVGLAGTMPALAQPPKVTPARPGAQPAKPNTPPAAAPPTGPAKTGESHSLPEAVPGTEEITLSSMTEPVELSALVEYVSKTLNLNTTIKGNLSGSVVFNAPVSVPKSRLLNLLDALLEQQGFTITYDADSQFYTVHPLSDVTFNPGGEHPTTRIIPTPNVRPSYLKPAIDSQFFGATAGQPQVPGQPGQTMTSKGIAYVDELGVIVVTESPRRLAAIEELIKSLLENYGKAEFTRLELKYIAAPQARQRAIQLVGQNTGQTTQQINPATGEAIQQPQGAFGGSRGIDNLSERLTVDLSGNALIFRGMPDEIDQVRRVLEIIDAPSKLKPKNWPAGSRARQVAEFARQHGLGEVVVISLQQQQQQNQQQLFPGFNPFDTSQGQAGQKTPNTAGGPVMVVDEKSGTIIYWGTDEQQSQLAALIEEMKVEDERIVIREYKLKHSDAEKVADLVLNLIQNTKPTGTSPLLSQGGGNAAFGSGSTSRTGYHTRSTTSRSGTTGQNLNTPNAPAAPSGGGGGSRSGGSGGAAVGTATPGAAGSGGAGDNELSLNPTEEVFVLADVANNQVLVKAPVRDQPEFRRLILDKLDQRRPQVYIEAKIVALTANNDFRLAFETQLINANGTGGVFNTNFGLSTFPQSGTQPILNPKTVATGLSGFTAALIRSDQVPIIITAVAHDADTRILSTPQILVDDNEEATVTSVEQQPTTTTSQTSGNPNVTSFGGYEEAGTTLTVTPHISPGGYLRMKYEVNLSNFEGSSAAGIPPPKLDNTLTSDSVTVPSNMTVVIGGLILDSKGKTVVKVPLLGDIPIIGALFSDQSKNDRQTTLYVFLTPKILQDPTIDDYLLLTKGPQSMVGLPPDIPELHPSIVEPIAPPAPRNGVPANHEPAVPIVEPPTPAPAPGNTDKDGTAPHRPPGVVEPPPR